MDERLKFIARLLEGEKMVPVCLCVSCQAEQDKQAVNYSGYNRRGSKDSQLR